MNSQLDLEKRGSSFVGRTFRGSIVENCSTAKMGKGHGNDGKPFDIETACYLKPVFEGIQRDSTRKVVIKAGVKTLKTFTVEASAGYYVPHGVGDATMYFGTGEAADDHATTRLLAYLRGIPSFAEKWDTIINRFNDTQSALKFPDKTFRICPANLTWTQNVNLCFVGICDAFLTARNGMIDQAWARTTQYPNDKKFIIESQGGEDGFDFDRHFEDTNQGELHVKCPLCASAHIWNWRAWDMTRPDDFVATPPLAIPSLDHAAWVSHHTPILKSEERKRCGFRRGDETKVKLPDGTYNEQEITRGTYFECFHCGGEWRDDGRFGATRIGLDQSSYYVSSRTTALPGHLGFSFPQWINRRLPWGAMMLQKLNTQKLHKNFGNFEPLKLWWQKVAGRTWSEKMLQTPVAVIYGTRNVSGAIPNEAARVMGIDCQQGDIPQKTGKFWVDSWAIDRAGKVLTQLERGFANSWKEWFDIKNQLKIPNDNLGIDGGHYLEEILDAAGANFEIVDRIDERTKKKFKARAVWKVLIGDGRRKSFLHGKDCFRSFSKPTYYQRRVEVSKGQFAVLNIPVYYWSNLSVKDHFYNLIRGGPNLPKFIALSRDQLTPATQLKEVGDLTYSKQIENQYRGMERGQAKWIETSPNVHYPDCGCECVVLFDMGGRLGLPAAADEDGQAV